MTKEEILKVLEETERVYKGEKVTCLKCGRGIYERSRELCNTFYCSNPECKDRIIFEYTNTVDHPQE